MSKELKMMNLKELNDLKIVASNLAEQYSKQLLTHGISNTEEYVNKLTDSQKLILEKRMKLIQLLSKLDNLIEEKISVYYD